MTPEEVASADDVDALYAELRLAKEEQRDDHIRRLERRLREIAATRSQPHPHRTPDKGKPVIVSPIDGGV